MYQLFRALKYMHTANVIHRDMKVTTATTTTTTIISVTTIVM